MPNSPRLTKGVTPKFTESDFQRLRVHADREGKRLGEWCRDRLLEVLNGPSASPSDHALLAEIAATQDMLIDLLCALGQDGRLTVQTAREIVNAAHKRKYKDVAELLRYAASRLQAARSNPSPRDKSTGGS